MRRVRNAWALAAISGGVRTGLLIAGGHRVVRRRLGDPCPYAIPRFPGLRLAPVRALSEKLDRLVGQTGLDPLTPDQPLAAYRVGRIEERSDPPGFASCSVAVGAVELRYADGSTRTYEIPAYRGLGRLFAHHEELPHLPAAACG